MPLVLRPTPVILETLLTHLLAGGVVTDIGHISVVRQLCEALASTQADLGYDLYTLLQMFYRTTAEGLDLDLRGRDFGVSRDPGQASSDPVTFTKTTSWIEDIALPAPQVLQATLADGTLLRYRSLGDHVLRPSGRSVSGQAPGTVLTGGTNDQLTLNLDGDGARTVILGTQTSPTAIAAAIQAAVRALTALDLAHQAAYNDFRCDYGVTTTGAYTLRGGTAGPTSSVVVIPAVTDDASVTLKLGLASGGLESVGTGSLSVPVLCDTIGVIGNVGAGQINQQQAPVPGIETVANALMFSNGREPASDDAYRQDILSYIHSLGVGGQEAVERAVYAAVGTDGQAHVLSAQVLEGVGHVQVYVCDGRSLTVGAQSDVISDVQDELDGLGSRPGGWIPNGTTAGVASASVTPVDVTVSVTLGPTPDLVQAQAHVLTTLYDLLYGAGVGHGITYATAVLALDNAVEEMLGVAFTLPTAWSTNPPTMLGGAPGEKLMPRLLNVEVIRA